MKKTASILAVLTFGIGTVMAGPAPVVSTGKGTTPPPPPPVDPCAGPISYNNVELLYANTDLDFGDTGDGVRLNIEWSPFSNFYVRLGGEYSTFELVDTAYLYGGIGGYVPLTENIHIAADGGFVYADFSYDNDYVVNPLPTEGEDDDFDIDDAESGWYVRPHLRAKWGCFELHAGATYRELWDDSAWTYWVSAFYQVAHNWDITAGYADGDTEGGEVITAGVRWRY